MNEHRLLQLLVSLLLAFPAIAGSDLLQTFVVRDYLNHQWTDEMVHFQIAYEGRETPPGLALGDAARRRVPCQVSGLRQKGGKVTGTLWTVVDLPPKGEVTVHLRRGASPPTSLRLTARGRAYVLRNEYMAIRLPRLPGALEPPAALDSLPAPLLAVAGPDGKNWLGQGAWTNAVQPLLVKEATTRVLEEGPVRVTVRNSRRTTGSGTRMSQSGATSARSNTACTSANGARRRTSSRCCTRVRRGRARRR